MRIHAVLFGLLSIAGFASVAVNAEEPSKHVHEIAAANSSNAVQLGGELQARTLVAADLAKFPRQQVTATAHGVSARYEGVNLIDVLADAGAPVGKALRGKSLALLVRVKAADGYQVAYSLAELDASFVGNRVLLVDRVDGVALSRTDGPFRLVAPAESRSGRWVRQVIAIDLIFAP